CQPGRQHLLPRPRSRRVRGGHGPGGLPTGLRPHRQLSPRTRPLRRPAPRAGVMGAVEWDPAQYRRFADQRLRPFRDLIASIDARDPALVVDLGCGPGHATALLGGRWPSAKVIGVDSSPAMIDAALSLV